MAEVYEDQHGNCYIGGSELYCGGYTHPIAEEGYYTFYLVRDGLLKTPRKSWRVLETDAEARLPNFVWNWKNLP